MNYQSVFDTLAPNLDKDKIFAYLNLLVKWNKTHNLTALKTIDKMITRHILDSLAIIPWIQGRYILDLGSGPGLPGIPLALANPSWQITLLDSHTKKTVFLAEVKRQLQLNNIEIINGRAEAYHGDCFFDTIVSRAFSNLDYMIKVSHHLIAKQGIWLAMKGHIPEEELKIISYPYKTFCYQVPNLNGQRSCVIIRNDIKD